MPHRLSDFKSFPWTNLSTTKNVCSIFMKLCFSFDFLIILSLELLQKPYLLRKRERDIASWNARKCKTVHSYENGTGFYYTSHQFWLWKKNNFSRCSQYFVFKLIFVLVTRLVAKMFILKCLPKIETHCQFWAISKFLNKFHLKTEVRGNPSKPHKESMEPLKIKVILKYFDGYI